MEEVSFGVGAGEILCIVGESGSGKSVSAGAVMGLLPDALRVVAGRIGFEGRDLLREPAAGMRALRGARLGMIFQEPMTALNPLMRVGDQVAEVMQVHGVAVGGRVRGAAGGGAPAGPFAHLAVVPAHAVGRAAGSG